MTETTDALAEGCQALLPDEPLAQEHTGDQSLVSLQSKALSLDVNAINFPSVQKNGKVTVCQENVLHALEILQITLGYDDFAREARVAGVPHQKYLNDDAIDEIYTALDYWDSVHRLIIFVEC